MRNEGLWTLSKGVNRVQAMCLRSPNSATGSQRGLPGGGSTEVGSVGGFPTWEAREDIPQTGKGWRKDTETQSEWYGGLEKVL